MGLLQKEYFAIALCFGTVTLPRDPQDANTTNQMEVYRYCTNYNNSGRFA